jgi:murein DD-endopeptidase MepM/ murein hydrolase activator NlpD
MRSSIFKLVLALFLTLCYSKSEGQVFPKIIKRTVAAPATTQERKNIELRTFDEVGYLKSLSFQTDSLFFQNSFDLFRVKSIISEESFNIDWAPTNKLVKISDEIQIDSIWITAFEYFSTWDSHRVDIYNFEASQIKENLTLKLYDLEAGQKWAMPLDRIIVTSNFGARWGRMHYGTDLGLATGDPVNSTFDGIVRIKGFDRYGWGNYYLVRHKNGLETLYGHLSKHVAELGEEVKAGDLLGKGGSTGRSTGPHLHYEVRYQGLALDAQKVFDFQKKEPLSDVLIISKRLFSQAAAAQPAAATTKSTTSTTTKRSTAYHKVKSGDSLSKIAAKYKVSVSQITKLNGISTRSVLKIGQSLRIK